MNYPRIYSLSTVGILKHYIHDYVFHPKRTDFIGSNGVGKSIIADLLQMIFIFDKELIRFGTDSVKREERKINTLPYKTNFAYCFLNVEVDENKFITIGIQINSQPGKRIIPFIITKEADLDLKMHQLAIEKHEILFSKNLISDGTIPDLQALSESLLETNKLRLNLFKNNDEVQNYYRFLYEKNITPLNLSHDRNLKAFAKVIQSFSKAKTLVLSGHQASKSLKEFLFEDSDEDILLNFNNAKADLEKILKEYDKLNEVIKTLTDKQKKLLHLRESEQNYSNLYKSYKQTEVIDAFFKLQKLKQSETETRALLGNQQKQLEKLVKLIQKIPRVETNIRDNFNDADKYLDSFNQFETTLHLILGLSKEINDLQTIIVPEIHDDWKNHVDKIEMKEKNIEEIRKSINILKPYLVKYETLDNIIKARDRQSDVLEELKATAKNEKSTKKRLLRLLENNSKVEDSLFQWYINNLPHLDDKQIQGLLHFATTPISKIDNPVENSRFLHAETLFNDFQTDSTKEGIWLNLGPLSEFIPFNDDAKLFQNEADLSKSIQKLIDKLKSEISDLDIRLEALVNISNASPYKTNLFEYSFDITIIENSSIEKLKQSIACTLQIDEKISELCLSKAALEDGILSFKSVLNITTESPEIIKQKLINIKKKWLDRVSKISRYEGQKTSDKNALEKEINKILKEVQEVSENVTSQQKDFDQLNKTFFELFQENITDFDEIVTVEESKNNYESAFEIYKSNYIGACHSFEETSNEKNPSIQFEIKTQSFSFRALEQASLGSKIKTTDDIAAALSEANQNRTMIADGIRDNMIKIFSTTASRYEKYDEQVKRINTFFINRKISDKFSFKLDFIENKDISIKFVKDIAYKVREAATQGELQFGNSIIDFIEDFFKKLAKIKDKVPIAKLLDPKTYFELNAKLNYESGEEVSGSTGETYSAIALLGVARLSAMQKVERKGLRFIILEELGSLDSTNFKTFPEIAEEFKYQIITMAPHTFNIGLSDDWYAHHLIKGKEDDKINYHPSSSFFKTSDYNEDLNIYLNKI
jgi:MukB-like protein